MDGDSVSNWKYKSYLRARDPSILSFNKPQLSLVKANLIEDFSEQTAISAEENEQDNDNIRVYLRIKAGYNFQDLYEIDGKTLVSIQQPSGRNVKETNSVRKLYKFTQIFEPETTQRDIFNNVVKPKLLDFINGQNSTLLTYGASGSGKTFTVIGTDEEPGVVPRSLEYLFRTLPNLSKNLKVKPLPSGEISLLNDTDCKKEKQLCRSLLNASCASLERTQHIKTYLAMQQRLSNEPAAQLDDFDNVSIGVWVSFAEIYNEQIYDLLQLDPPRGTQRPRLRLGMANGHAYIKNLTNVSVTSGQEAYQILQYGIHNLNYAPTLLNKHSSRSHSIFTIKLVQISLKDGGSCISCFNFCDLAGSERSKKTQNVGERLKESNNINNSLLVLGRCISAVRNLQKENKDQKCVPFRESKLTQLFQKALAGAEDIAMIVNISPSREMFDESQHVLNFSAIAKEICIEAKPDPVRKNRFSLLVEGKKDEFYYSEEDYKNLIQHLQDELEQQRIDFEVTQKMNLDYLRQGYDKILENINEDVKKTAEKTRQAVKSEYEAKMEILRLKYERKLREVRQKYEVIKIDDSDEESEEEEEDIERKNYKYEREIRTLKETLNEGVRDFRQLQQKYNQLELENVKLKDKIQELESELEVGRDYIFQLSMEKHSDSEDAGDAK